MSNLAVNPLSLMALANASNGLGEVILAPLKKWQHANIAHKLLALSLGTAAAYYSYKKGLPDASVAAIGLGTAYGTSLFLHYPSIRQSKAVSNLNGMGGNILADSQVQSMAHQAEMILSHGNPNNEEISALQAGNVNEAEEMTVKSIIERTKSAMEKNKNGTKPDNQKSKWAALGD